MAVIWVSRSRNLAVGMADDQRPEPPAPPAAGRPAPGAFPALLAGVGEVEVLDHDRACPVLGASDADQGGDGGPDAVPSRWLAGSPARARGIVTGGPAGFPSGVSAQAARWPAFTSTATTGCARSSPRSAGGAGRRLPARVQVPASRVRVQADVVADRAGRGLRRDLIAPVGEGRPGRTAGTGRAAGSPGAPAGAGSLISSQPSSGLNLMVSFPQALSFSPSAVRNSRSASHRSRHWPAVIPAAARFARARSSRRPPRTHRHPPGGDPLLDGGEPRLQRLQPPLLGEPLGLARVAAGPVPSSSRPGPRACPRSPGPATAAWHGLRAQVPPGQLPLVLRRAGHRPRPPRARRRRSAPASAPAANAPAPARPAAPPGSEPPGQQTPATPGAGPPRAAPPHQPPTPAAGSAPAHPTARPRRTGPRSPGARPPSAPTLTVSSMTRHIQSTI